VLSKNKRAANGETFVLKNRWHLVIFLSDEYGRLGANNVTSPTQLTKTNRQLGESFPCSYHFRVKNL
jgi:hypothetical protein